MPIEYELEKLVKDRSIRLALSRSLAGDGRLSDTEIKGARPRIIGEHQSIP